MMLTISVMDLVALAVVLLVVMAAGTCIVVSALRELLKR